MALPLLFFIGSSLIRAATPVIAKMLVKQGYKRASSAVVKNALKNSKKIRTIGSKKDIPISKSKSLTVPKNQSTALTKINKTTGGNKSKLINGKVITAATTVASVPALIAKKDDKKGEAKANTKKGKVDAGLQEALKKKARDAKNKKMNDIEKSTRGQKSKSKSTTATTTMTFGKAFRAAKDAGKKEFTYKGKKYHTRTKDEDKKAAANPPIPKSRPKTEKKVEKKTPNYGGAQTIPKRTENKVEKKKSKSFLDKVKEDFDKAVKETKRNLSDKRYFVNGVDSRKEKIKSKSNIKKKK
jgi:hypothetical protein